VLLMSNKIAVVVAVEAESSADFDDVVNLLQKAGMHVDQPLEAIGAVTGSVSVDHLKEIESVPGVHAVDQQRTYEIAPRWSEVQ
jgi:hypothetical protein